MALSAILSNQKKRVQFIQGGNTVIELDCSVRERHNWDSHMTEFEIENGQTISDHIVNRPAKLEIQGIISDAPLSLITGLLTAAVGHFTKSAAVLGKAAPALALLPAFDFSSIESRPSTKAYLQLLSLRAQKLPIDVYTSLYNYKNMFIKNISVPRESRTGQMLLFDIELVQLLIVQPSTVSIVKFADAAVSAGKGEKGQQEATQPGSDAAAKGFKAGLGVLGVK